MNEKNKIRVAVLCELGICIIMLVSFLFETSRLFQFFDLFLAIVSLDFLFENRRKFEELDDE